MQGVLPFIVVIALSVLVSVRAAQGLNRLERQLVWVGWALHIGCSVALVVIVRDFYGYGDVLTYGMYGKVLSDLMWADFARYVPAVVRLLLHLDSSLPFTVMGEGSSTGSMAAIAAIWAFFLAGSLQAMCTAMAVVAFAAKVAMYRCLRGAFEVSLRPGILFAFVLIPTVAFWSAGIVKESVAMTALCLLVCAMRFIDAGRILKGALLAATAATALGLVKPYILFAFILAVGAWFYARRAIAATGPGFRPKPVVRSRSLRSP